MRVIECDECGETISASNDAELVDLLEQHHSDDHEELDRGDLEELVADGAYDATDA